MRVSISHCLKQSSASLSCFSQSLTKDTTNETEREQRTIVIGTSLSDELVTSAEIGLNLRDVNVHHIRHDFGFANEIWATWRSDRKRRSGSVLISVHPVFFSRRTHLSPTRTMSLKDRFVQLLEKNEEVPLSRLTHFQGLEDKEIKKVFGEEYAGLVSSIQELLDEVTSPRWTHRRRIV